VILLDTHSLIWWISEPTRVPAKASRAIAGAVRAGEPIAASSISIWEIAMLVDRGRLTLTMDVDSWIGKVETLPFLTFIPIDNQIAARSVRLERFPNRDPADRMIVATALGHGASLITADAALHKYRSVKTIWD
jgi:PIN domain nuclease of toxin-antitoxin system